MNTTNISFSELVKAVSNGKSYITKHLDIDNTFYTCQISKEHLINITFSSV